MSGNSSSASSTNYDPSYSRNIIVSAKPVINANNKADYVTEFFSIGLVRLLRVLAIAQTGQIGTVPLVTQAFLLYGNTTCWWLIALANGFGNPLAVESYEVIGYPDITVLNSLNDITANVNENQSNVTI